MRRSYPGRTQTPPGCPQLPSEGAADGTWIQTLPGVGWFVYFRIYGPEGPDLRHTGGTLSAVTGATLKELMARLGHSSVRAALIYQHATRDRDQAIARVGTNGPRLLGPTRTGSDSTASDLGWSMRAGDRDRTGMTSFEGFGPLEADQDKRRSGGMSACP